MLFTIFIPLCILQAQKKKVKEADSYEAVLDSMSVYNFEAAIEILEEDITKRTKRKKPTEEAESLLTLAHRNLGKLLATERLTIIDSIIVKKEDALKHIHLSKESGSLLRMSEFSGKLDTMDCIVFRNQLNNHTVFSQMDANGQLTLYQSTLIGNEWTKPVPLKGIKGEEELAQHNYPFMLTDGATLYYAAKDEESLGGYDIYMTRFDADEQQFLTPENVGMPFNSPANDYLLCIDEFYNLGWFVTDRNMLEGNVCVYTFIPNETRQIYNEAEIGMEKLRQMAYIHSIQSTWFDETLVKESLAKLQLMRMAEKNSEDTRQFEFVLNDKKTCYSEKDFTNNEAKKKVNTWMELTKSLEQTKNKLDILRDNYPSYTDSQKQQLNAQIKQLEEAYEKLLKDIRDIENTIRKLELGK